MWLVQWRRLLQALSRTKSYNDDDQSDPSGTKETSETPHNGSKGTSSELARVLGLMDLTLLGIGSTLGVGVYVLAGSVAKNQAGPAVLVSLLIAAVASLFSGLCYVEFASRISKTGSAYTYTYLSIGEFAAFTIGWNLVLEYVIGTASEAKAISNQFDSLLGNVYGQKMTSLLPMKCAFLADYPDFIAAGITLTMTGLISYGVAESTRLNSVFTFINLGTVFAIVLCGLSRVNPANWTIRREDIPQKYRSRAGTGGFAPFGLNGIIVGAAKCFFGFVGFDCIATTGEESKNPKRNIPLSILLSLLIVFLCFFAIALVLTLVIPYYEQDADAPFPHIFDVLGLPFMKWVVTIGSVFALLTGMFGALFPLPRILYAMSQDGLLYPSFAYVSPRTKTPVISSLLSGLLTAVLSAIFKLDQLVDMLSIGTLLAYTIVALSVLILRYSEDEFSSNSNCNTESHEYRIDYKKCDVPNSVGSMDYEINCNSENICSKSNKYVNNDIAKPQMNGVCRNISLFENEKHNSTRNVKPINPTTTQPSDESHGKHSVSRNTSNKPYDEVDNSHSAAIIPFGETVNTGEFYDESFETSERTIVSRETTMSFERSDIRDQQSCENMFASHRLHSISPENANVSLVKLCSLQTDFSLGDNEALGVNRFRNGLEIKQQSVGSLEIENTINYSCEEGRYLIEVESGVVLDYSGGQNKDADKNENRVQKEDKYITEAGYFVKENTLIETNQSRPSQFFEDVDFASNTNVEDQICSYELESQIENRIHINAPDKLSIDAFKTSGKQSIAVTDQPDRTHIEPDRSKESCANTKRRKTNYKSNIADQTYSVQSIMANSKANLRKDSPVFELTQNHSSQKLLCEASPHRNKLTKTFSALFNVNPEQSAVTPTSQRLSKVCISLLMVLTIVVCLILNAVSNVNFDLESAHELPSETNATLTRPSELYTNSHDAVGLAISGGTQQNHEEFPTGKMIRYNSTSESSFGTGKRRRASRRKSETLADFITRELLWLVSQMAAFSQSESSTSTNSLVHSVAATNEKSVVNSVANRTSDSVGFSRVAGDSLNTSGSFETLKTVIYIAMGVAYVLVFLVLARQNQTRPDCNFKVPLVPLIPCLSIFMNVYLMINLDVSTWVRFVVWMIIGMGVYFTYGIRHSKLKIA